MTCLVTGGTGFIGSWVAKAILEAGHKVVVFDLNPNMTIFNTVLGDRAKEITIVQGDLTQLYTVLNVIKQHNVTHIAHIAAAVLKVCAANPPLAMRINVMGMTNMLEACRIMGIQRMVWASSAGVFGGGWDDKPIPNDARFRPHGIYGASKVMGEALAEHYNAAYGVDVIGLRYSFVTGHGMPDSVGRKAIVELCEKPALGEPSQPIWTEDTPDFLWAGDAGRATAMALDCKPTKTRAFNVGGDPRKMTDAIAYVQKLCPGAKMELQPGKMGFNKLDLSTTTAEIGYTPEWTMERQMVAHVNRARASKGLPLVQQI